MQSFVSCAKSCLSVRYFAPLNRYLVKLILSLVAFHLIPAFHGMNCVLLFPLKVTIANKYKHNNIQPLTFVYIHASVTILLNYLFEFICYTPNTTKTLSQLLFFLNVIYSFLVIPPRWKRTCNSFCICKSFILIIHIWIALIC